MLEVSRNLREEREKKSWDREKGGGGEKIHSQPERGIRKRERRMR